MPFPRFVFVTFWRNKNKKKIKKKKKKKEKKRKKKKNTSLILEVLYFVTPHDHLLNVLMHDALDLLHLGLHRLHFGI